MTDPRESKKFPFKPGSAKPESVVRNPTVNTANTVRLAPGQQDRVQAKDFASLRESSVTPLPDDLILKDGQFRVGPYVVSHELAHGGMGAVYMAEDPILERKVALKIMASSLLSDEEAVRRFQREARATAKIDHPNIARIYMVGQTDDGSPFIAMEFVDGGTLEGMIRRREDIPYSIVADFMIQASEGLNAGLKQSIIHRDLKPANIMLTENNLIKVVDFGLAKLYNEETFRTIAGMVMGTPRYMSPEQAQGREVDHRSDIYSLGATFYHLLSGVSPFEGDNPTQIMMKQVTAPLTPLRNHKQTIPLEFDELIRKCMAKEPMMRFQRYEDLIAEAAKIKLQWRAREKGNPYELRTVPSTLNPQRKVEDLEGTSIVPSLQQVQPMEELVPPTPLWRWYVIGGFGLAALLGILVIAVSMATKASEPIVNIPVEEKTGLHVLIQAIMDSKKAQTERMKIPDMNPDYAAWQATTSIMNNLNQGVSDYEIEFKTPPAKLRDVVRSKLIFQNFDVESDDTPLDGWSIPFEYRASSKMIVSAGLDQRHGTADDLTVSQDESLSSGDEEAYMNLELQEYNRTNSVNY